MKFNLKEVKFNLREFELALVSALLVELLKHLLHLLL
jgi:hypothetical protein